MSTQKPKIVAIRSTPEQTALLKATYSVSYNPSPKTIAELSQRTGLPAKWISNWFSRQRTKSRKNGEIIDMTSAIGDVTPVIKVEEENLDVSVADCSSSPSMLDIQVSSITEKAGPVKAPRKRPPRKSKAKKKSQTVVKVESQETLLPAAAASSVPMQRCPPQLLPLVTVSCRAQTPLPVPPPTRSGMASRPQANRIYSQNTTANAEAMPEAHAHENVLPTHHRRQNRPIMRNGFRHSVPSDYYSDPISADAASPYQKDLDCDSHRASSPIQSLECSASDFAPAHSMINHFTLASTAGSSIAQPAAIDQQLLSNLHSQALAVYTALYRNNPAVHRAMLLNYAALFPTLLPALAGTLAASGSIPSSNRPAIPAPVSVECPIGENALTDTKVPPSLPSFNPEFPLTLLNDDNLEVPVEPLGYSSSAMEPEAQGTQWDPGSDYLDFSSLHYDCAPLSHLQERLEPFRLPESTYLFGREGVVNHLLDERFGVEEPFQAAMGLVLLSKLGLEW